ncbi:MAG TPA: hypothetical protein VGM39_17600 [Kofleriaceae bacterium]
MKNLTIAFLATSALFTVGACKKKGGGDAGEAVAKVTEFKDKMCACKDKDCATKVNDDYTKWGTEMASKMASNKDTAKPDETMAKKMTEVAMAYGECMTKAMGAGATPPAGDTGSAAAPAAGSGSAPAAEGSAAPAAAGGDLPAGIPQECKDYADAMAKLGTCDKMPKESKDAMKQGFDAMKTGWANFDKMPAEAQKAAADACKQGTDAMKQSASALGC